MARIIVIDDNEAARSTMRRVLERVGHEVLEASEGDAGLKLLAETGVTLVITDIFMPQKDGIETIRELRRTNPEIKIIALSGDVRFDGPGILNAAHLLGADQVIEKPFRNDELVRIAEQVLANKSAFALVLIQEAL